MQNDNRLHTADADIAVNILMNEELNSILSSIPCGLFAYTLPEREILVANDEIRRIFNFKDNDIKLLIDKMFDNTLPEDRLDMRDAIKNIKEVGDSCTYRLHPISDKGKRLTIECKTKMLEFKNGQKFILSVLNDVTQNERIINEIRKERKQYRNAIITDSEYSYRFDVTEGIVKSDFDSSIRGSIEDNLDIKMPIAFDELINTWVKKMRPKFLTPDDQNPMTSADLTECYRKGMRNVVTEYYNESEAKYFRRNILLSEDDTTGHIWAIAIINDITDSVREETRKQNELLLINRDLNKHVKISQAFGSFYFASWEINLLTRRIKSIVIPENFKILSDDKGNNYNVLFTEMIETYVHDDYKEIVRHFVQFNDINERLKDVKILTCDYQEKSLKWVSACIIPVTRDEAGFVTRIIFAIREISQEKRIELEAKKALEEAYESANRANAAKTEFLSSISHDIRTPMNGIIGMTAIAATHLDDRERVSDCLSKISLSSKHLLSLINEVLDMNKIESGKLDLNTEEFCLPDLMDTLLVMAKPQIDAKGHNFSVNIYDIDHENVVGDSLRIQQVFVNLVSNAIKYTPNGGNIKLSLTEKSSNNNKIGCFEFIVEDNGIGMSAEFKDRLFEPFSRARDSRVDKIQGTGLGMSIARNIVRMMNGDITVDSELGKGTKMTVTMFLELQNENDNITPEDFIDLPILVADADEITCKTTCEILDELGMKSEWVLSGEEAIDKAKKRHETKNDYYAIILDWKMPGMDGVETTKAIREFASRNMPIILSSYDWSEIEQEARVAGVTSFVSKPLFKSRVSYLFKTLMGKVTPSSDTSEIKNLSELNFEGKRALLAEDNDINAEIASELLKTTGLSIDHAVNGKEAVDLVSSNPYDYYDIIFMDIQMPVMNGYEATRAIRSLSGDYVKRIPIIAMTANAFAEDVHAAKGAGMNEHIAKPLDIRQLSKTLQYWLIT